MRLSHISASFQVLVCIIVGLAYSGVNVIYGFSGITLPELTQPDSEDIYLTPINAALFGSLVNLGAACGGIIVGPIIAWFGPRKTLLLTLPVTLALWILLAFSPDATCVLLTRMGLGVMLAAIYVISNAYVVEISHTNRRGILTGAVTIGKEFGIVFVYSIGSSSLSWRQIALICSAVTTIIPFFGLFFFQDSPRWLVTKDRNEEAKTALIFFRGEKYNFQSELNDIIKQVSTTSRQSAHNQCIQLLEKSNLKVFLKLLILTCFMSGDGSAFIRAYAVPIFQFLGSNVDPYTSAILMGVVSVTGVTVCTVIAERFSRKFLVICSYTIMSISFGLLAHISTFKT